jgi:hypothetical protein
MELTAVEWLIKELICVTDETIKSKCEQALAMEKQQIIKAFNEGTFANDERVNAEQYYNETFKK